MTVHTTYEARPSFRGQWSVLRIMRSTAADGPPPDVRVAYGPEPAEHVMPGLDEAAARRLARALTKLEAQRG